MSTMTKLPAAPTWDLESLFPGGGKSPQFAAFRDRIKAGIAEAEQEVRSLPQDLTSGPSQQQWVSFILKLQKLYGEIVTMMSFGGMLVSQDVNDSDGHAIMAESDERMAQWEKLRTSFEALSVKAPDPAWQNLLQLPELRDMQFRLNEIRSWAREKMAPELEALLVDLSVNGYHAWNRVYDKLAGDARVTLEVNGEEKSLSLGQLSTFMDHQDRDVRARAFAKLTEAWKERADLAAMILNSMSGFRLSMYQQRGWPSVLKEPLHVSRLQKKSLDTMWEVIRRETPRLKPYIEAKKRLLGIDKFRWYDEFVPCAKVHNQYPYDEAANFIVDNVRSFSEDMASFYREAIDKRWIEAEDRPGKRGGGYCTHLPVFKQGRIFMTYGGSFENLLTLAHELGHLYHSHVMRDHPILAQDYPMTLAETASIFSETLVLDAALATAKDPAEKIMLLDQKIQQAYVFFTDIQTRYLFDLDFYAQRAKGTLSPEQLCDMMVQAQKTAFQGLLDESGYHPYFWCSKLHFFITDTPFYNFPYTFGFLFAGGVYDRARTEGKSFAAKYRALLEDTGRMTTEDCAKKHLGVDLTTEEFWTAAVNRSLSSVDEFVRLANQQS